MAIADRWYVDPSALLKLYLREAESRVMTRWRFKHRGPLPLTHHGRVEVANGIALASYRGLIDSSTRIQALAAFAEDVTVGRYYQADLLWRATLNLALDLSRRHAAVLGCRTLDLIHVASAVELGASRFLSFDQRQLALCRAVGLKTATPRVI